MDLKKKVALLLIPGHLVIPEQISVPCSVVITMHFHVKSPEPAAVERCGVRLWAVIGRIIKKINVSFIADRLRHNCTTTDLGQFSRPRRDG